MACSRKWLVLLVAGHASMATAQLSPWIENQVSATMCTWAQLRAAVVRDTVYMDGGQLYWTPQMADGSYDLARQDTNPHGVVFALNFSKPFNTSQNISALFDQLEKGPTAEQLYDGGMLANDNEFYLYGGERISSDATDGTGNSGDYVWRGYSYGADKPQFDPDFYNYATDHSPSLNIVYGGVANAPSENLAFYFSGYHTANWSQIYYPSSNRPVAAEVANTLVTLDMSTQYQETWKNDTLPDDIAGRANPELVWVPVGQKGILVTLGGVTYPAFAYGNQTSANETASKDESPDFMTNINIYDIANTEWHSQSTSGGPGALTRGCAVMQPASDHSSFNIYWYGGFDGLNMGDKQYWTDEVWVLSLPSFTWTQVASGRSGMARAGHKCVMPYPDQMMVIGGQPALEGNGWPCLDGSVIQLFNVSSAEWLDSYDPNVWSPYQVPSAVREAIGGDGSGSATKTAPSSWDATELSAVFQTTYDTSKITTYYPYKKAAATGGTNPSVPTTTSHSHGGGTPKYLGPVLGVVLGLVFITSLVVGILLWRRRKLLKKNAGQSEAATDEHGNRILSWINGQPRGGSAKAPTITSSEEMTSVQHTSPTPDIFYSAPQYPFPQQQSHVYYSTPMHHEMDDTQVVELPDNSPPAAELSDAPLSPSDIVARHSRVGGSQAYSSLAGGATDYGSMVSSQDASSIARNIPPAPPSTASQSTSAAGSRKPAEFSTAADATTDQKAVRPDSAALPTPLASAYKNNLQQIPEPAPTADAPTTADPLSDSPRGESGVSAFSERERSHLRNLSDPATVSTMDAVIAPRSEVNAYGGGRAEPIIEEGGAFPHTDPLVSPPTADDAEGAGDYVSARSVVSPVQTQAPGGGLGVPGGVGSARRSAFTESQEDLNDVR